MSDFNDNSMFISKLVRAIVLIIISLLLMISSVSFVMHHMRLQYEQEYREIAEQKMQQVSSLVKMSIDGDEISQNSTQEVADKYNKILQLVLSGNDNGSLAESKYAMFLYSGGKISLFFTEQNTDYTDFAVTKKDISDWILTKDNYVVNEDDYSSILLPIIDSNGKRVAVFEYYTDFSKLETLGNKLEKRILISVIISMLVCILLFIIYINAPKYFLSKRKGGNV